MNIAPFDYAPHLVLGDARPHQLRISIPNVSIRIIRVGALSGQVSSCWSLKIVSVRS